MVLFSRKSIAALFIFLCLVCFVSADANAQVVLNSLTATPSTCPNNGSISVAATSSSPPLLYSIISGPVTQPVQTGSVFNSLPPGAYTIRVSDGAGNSTTGQVQITGTYVPPDFTVVKTSPYCVGDHDGIIAGTVLPGTGQAPYTWEMIAPSVTTSPAQTSGTFDSIPAGNYTMRVTDACGSFRTLAVTLSPPNTAFSIYGGLIAEKIGCDSMMVLYKLRINEPRLPFTYRYTTSDGTFIPTGGTSVDTTFITSGFITVRQLIPGLTYGDFIGVTVYNACGDSTVTGVLTTYPFIFYPKFTYNGCGDLVTPTFENTNTNTYHTALNTPVTYTLTNVATNTLTSSGTLNPSQEFGVIGVTSTQAVPVGGTYHLKITDGCGETYENNYTMPAQAPPAVVHGIVQSACIDSVVGVCYITASGFSNPRVVITSGPPGLGSTKPEFAYSDTYSYPDTLGVGYGNNAFLQNLGPGTYYFKVIDDCGRSISDSIVILPQQVTSLTRDLSYEKGCPGENKIFFSLMAGGKVTVKQVATNTVVKVRTLTSNSPLYNRDSVLNLPAGLYEVVFEFQQTGYGTP